MNQEKTQKTNNFRKMLLTIPLLLLSFIALTVSTYAYWNMLTQTKDETITLGEGDTITVSETLAGSGILIPTGQTPTGSEVTAVEFKYDVSINTEAFVAGAKNLTVTISNVKIGGSATDASLVKFSINETTGDLTETFTNVLSTTNYVVTIIVTLTEPGTQTVYDAIIDQNITFNVNFTAA